MINNISSSSSYIENVYDTKDDNDISFLWHVRLSHISKIYLKRMSDLGLIPKFNFNFDICESCLRRKMTKKPLANNKDMKIIKYYPF